MVKLQLHVKCYCQTPRPTGVGSDTVNYKLNHIWTAIKANIFYLIIKITMFGSNKGVLWTQQVSKQINEL